MSEAPDENRALNTVYGVADCVRGDVFVSDGLRLAVRSTRPSYAAIAFAPDRYRPDEQRRPSMWSREGR